MLRNFVEEHQDDWDNYGTVVIYANNIHVPRTTRTTPFNLLLSLPPPLFHFDHSVCSYTAPSKEQRKDYFWKLQRAIQNVRMSLHNTQARCMNDFDKHGRATTRNICAGQYKYLDAPDGTTKESKLGNHALCPFRTIQNDTRTLILEREGNSDRFSVNRAT